MTARGRLPHVVRTRGCCIEVGGGVEEVRWKNAKKGEKKEQIKKKALLNQRHRRE